MHNHGFRWFAVSLVTVLFIVTCAKTFEYVGSVKRFSKGLESNWRGGLNRTVTLYDYNGKPLKQWTGKIDMSDATDEADFLVDDRRVIIHGGITVIEEDR